MYPSQRKISKITAIGILKRVELSSYNIKVRTNFWLAIISYTTSLKKNEKNNPLNAFKVYENGDYFLKILVGSKIADL